MTNCNKNFGKTGRPKKKTSLQELLAPAVEDEETFRAEFLQ